MRAASVRCFAARACAVASLAWLALAASPASALVHMANDGNGNTTPPADDFGFANVGVMSNGLTGVYLGDGWVLTARHVGAADITLAGVSYPLVPGSWVQLQHAPGVGADLAMERISGSPPLPALSIAPTAPVVGETVTMAGNGWARQAVMTCWDASWVEASCQAPPPSYRGFKRLSGAAPGPRWGRNLVTMTGIDVSYSGMTTQSFETAFDLSALPEEAQAVSGDSGGGVFVKRGTWQLVGVLFAVDTFVGQPGSTAVFGSHTYSVELAHYRSQILGLMNPAVPALAWPHAALACVLLAGCARAALSGRRRRRS